MGCFSLGFIEHLLIWLVVVGAVIALLRLIVPVALGALGGAGSLVVGALNIILWAIVIIAAIVVVFSLLACVWPIPLAR